MQLVRENENIVGIKMAHGADVPRYLRDAEALRQLDRHVAILPASGRVVHLLNLAGADESVTGFPNFVAEEIDEMFEAAKAGDTVRVLEAEDSIRPVAKIIASDPFYYMHLCYKEVTRLLGRIPNALVWLGLFTAHRASGENGPIVRRLASNKYVGTGSALPGVRATPPATPILWRALRERPTRNPDPKHRSQCFESG